MRRLLASGMLAAIVLSFATPPLVRGGAPMGCPLAPGGGGAPQLVAGMDGGACEHADAHLCLAALGCVNVAPAAIRPPAALLLTPTRLIVLGAALTPRVGDLYLTGPPTPPPNYI